MKLVAREGKEHMMPSRLEFLSARLRGRAKRFTFRFEAASEVPGAPFQVQTTIRCHFDRRPQDLREIELRLRSEVFALVVAKTQAFDVLEVFAAEAAAAASVLYLTGRANGAAGYRARTKLQLNVSPESRVVGEAAHNRRRDRNHEIEEQTVSLREVKNMLSDPVLTRIWWAERSSTTLEVLGKDYVETLLAKADEQRQAEKLTEGDEVLAVTVELVRWILSDETRSTKALVLLQHMLPALGRVDLRDRLPEPSDMGNLGSMGLMD